MPEEQLITRLKNAMPRWMTQLNPSRGPMTTMERQTIIEEMREFHTELRLSDGRETRDDPSVREGREDRGEGDE